MTLPSSGQLDIGWLHAEFGLGHNLGAYRGVKWWMDGNQQGTFSSNGISIGEFYSKRASSPVSAGVWESSTPGSHTFVIPMHDWLTVECWGAGGGGGGYGADRATYGGEGGQSSVLNVFAFGGGGGEWKVWQQVSLPGNPGAPGGAEGGDVNTPGGGNPGGQGGAFTQTPQQPPFTPTTDYAGTGGAGGYARKTFGYGTLGYGGETVVAVGQGGSGGTSDQNAPEYMGQGGSNGRVRITWGRN